MVNTSLKRRRTEEQLRGKVPKKEKRKVKKQKHYHSSSDEEEGGARDAPVRGSSEEPEEPFQPSGANATLPGKKDLSKQQLRKQAKFEAKKAAQQAAAAEESSASDDDDDDDKEVDAAPSKKKKPEAKFKASIPAKAPTKAPAKSALKKTAPVDHEAPLPSDAEDDAEDDSEPEADEFSIADSESDALEDSDTSTVAARKVRKRNDPEAFGNSISRILGSKLSTSKRSEPILSRSKDAATANRELADSKLTEKARRQVVAERKAAQDKGRVKDVLGLNDPNVSTAATSAREKELRRTAQKGVIKLFNAVRAAQVKGEQAERESKAGLVVGMDKREEKVKEMSKQGFLDMITGGQKREESAEA
ncbi:rrp15p-domain-containing protein [Stemphylium lycopersici]|uniref:Rrp15p-domain-containing protein n=1 Tax=Stemphylium lycopersici TaxID=183478 RepID=A0A364MZS0_STELY|nr:rrp15p-domain-containing protein [Stemphylium lycopersici]RAR08214.1 rrp15p-domain-containing protein [Stemphylium lycopersici]